MRIPYLCVNALMGDAPQRDMLKLCGFTDKQIDEWRETNPETRDRREYIISRKLRFKRKEPDEIWVSDLHQLANRSDDLPEVIAAVHERNAVVVEARSEARSTSGNGKFLKALHQATYVMAGMRSRADRSRAAKEAYAKRSQARRDGFPPPALIEHTVNNHGRWPTLLDAIEHLNSLGYRNKLNKSLIYRRAKFPDGDLEKIHLAERKAGPKLKL